MVSPRSSWMSLRVWLDKPRFDERTFVWARLADQTPVVAGMSMIGVLAGYTAVGLAPVQGPFWSIPVICLLTQVVGLLIARHSVQRAIRKGESPIIKLPPPPIPKRP